MLKVLIPEKIPAHNKGEEAIFRGILKTLDFVTEKKIFLYSKSPCYDKAQYAEAAEIITESLIPDPTETKAKKILHVLWYIPLHVIYAFVYRINHGFARKIFKKKLWEVYDKIDFVLAAHDSAYAIMHNLLIIFCKMINKPIIIYGTSILPFLHRRAWVRYLTRFCLNMADLVTVREEITRNVLVEKIGIRRNLVKLTGDKAFLLEPVGKEKIKRILESHDIFCDKETIIGITSVYKTGIFNTLQFDIEKHINIMAMIVDFIIEETNAKVVFFPHSVGPDEANDDRIAASAIFDKCNHKESIKLINGDFAAAQLKGMIGCCDFFIGERTHSVIAALSMKVPAIAISHPEDYRTIGILGKIVERDKWIFNIKQLEEDSFKQFFLRAWYSREELRKSLHQKIQLVTKMSIKNGEYLQELLKRKRLLSKLQMNIL